MTAGPPRSNDCRHYPGCRGPEQQPARSDNALRLRYVIWRRISQHVFQRGAKLKYDRRDSGGSLGNAGLTCSLKICWPRAAGRIFLLTMHLAASAYFAPAYAHPVDAVIHYTRYEGVPNVKKVAVRFDGQNLTFGQPESLASVNGADGIVFTPDGDLIVGGQGDRVHRLHPDGSGLRSVTAGGGKSFHVTMDPGGRRVWTAGLPGTLSEVPLEPFGDGRLHVLRGDDVAITAIAFDATGRAFYTASTYKGGGSFGVLDLTAMTTRRLIDDLEAAHGIAFDTYSGDLILFGGNQIVQIDPARPGEIKDSRRFELDSHFDQGVPDGRGHLFVSRNGGNVVFVDYAETKRIAHRDNIVLVVYLDSYLDDIAPLISPPPPPEETADKPEEKSPEKAEPEQAEPEQEESEATGTEPSEEGAPPCDPEAPSAAGSGEDCADRAEEGAAPAPDNEETPPEEAGETPGAKPDETETDEEESGEKKAESAGEDAPSGEDAAPPAAGSTEEGTDPDEQGAAPAPGNEAASPEAAGENQGAEPGESESGEQETKPSGEAPSPCETAAPSATDDGGNCAAQGESDSAPAPGDGAAPSEGPDDAQGDEPDGSGQSAPPSQAAEGEPAAPASADAAASSEAAASPGTERRPQGLEPGGDPAQADRISTQPAGDRPETSNRSALIAGAIAVFLAVAALAALSMAVFAGNALLWGVLAAILLGGAVYEGIHLVQTLTGGSGAVIDLSSSLPEEEETVPGSTNTSSILDGKGKSPDEPASFPWAIPLFGALAAVLLAGGLVAIALRRRNARQDPPVEDEPELPEVDPDSHDADSTLAFLEAANAALHDLMEDEPPDTVLANLASRVAKGSGSRHAVIGNFADRPDGKRSVSVRAIGDGERTGGGKSSADDFTLSPDSLDRLGGDELAAGRCVILARGHADKSDKSSQGDAAPVDTFLGLPLGGAKGVFGLLGLVDRAEGYNKNHAAFLAPVALIAETVLGSMHETDRDPNEDGEGHPEKADILTESGQRVGKIGRWLRERYADGLGETGRLALDQLVDTTQQILERAGITDGGDDVTPEEPDSLEGTSEGWNDERPGIDENAAEEDAEEIGGSLESVDDEKAPRPSDSQLRDDPLDPDRAGDRGSDAGGDAVRDSDGPAEDSESRERHEGEASQRLTSFRII